MSTVSAKNLILSQPKTSQTEPAPTSVLTHTLSTDDSTITIKIEIPGVDPSTVDVECEGTLLQVSCERGEFVHPLDPTIDTSEIKADIQWGLLTLTIPMPAPPVSRSIKVSVHDAVKKAPSKFTKEE